MNTLAGYRTYIAAGLLALLGFAKAVGWLDETTYQAATAIAGAMGLAALRKAVGDGKE